MKKIILLSILSMLSVEMVFAQDAPSKINEIGLVFSNLNSFGLRYKHGNENTLLRITALSLSGSSIDNSYSSYTFNGISDQVPSAPTNTLGGGLNIGIERRMPINDKFYFFCGVDWINSYTESKTTVTTPSSQQIGYWVGTTIMYTSVIVNNTTQTNVWSTSSGLGIALGGTLKINDSFSVAVELLPSVSYKYTETNIKISSYNVAWSGSSSSGYTPSIFNNRTNSDAVNQGLTYNLTNGAASITLTYRFKRG